MPKMKALRPLYGDYGRVTDGQIFECTEAAALSLESRGLAERHHEPLVNIVAKMLGYENKMLQPPHAKAMPTEPPPVEIEPPAAPYKPVVVGPPPPAVTEEIRHTPDSPLRRRRHAR